jgi:hypothetical protein
LNDVFLWDPRTPSELEIDFRLHHSLLQNFAHDGEIQAKGMREVEDSVNQRADRTSVGRIFQLGLLIDLLPGRLPRLVLV